LWNMGEIGSLCLEEVSVDYWWETGFSVCCCCCFLSCIRHVVFRIERPPDSHHGGATRTGPQSPRHCPKNSQH
jgi:hypothetical protein